MNRLLITACAGAATLAWRSARARRKRTERLAAATLESLLNAIDANDHETGAHVRRVAEFALLLADAAGLDGRELRDVERVALFHDVGKISEALFDIVHDDSALTPAEREAIATHPERGAAVLAPLSAFYPELPAGIVAHHERWDGGGYPRGLRGEEIPLIARIVTIADSFDAITHTRRYRAGIDATQGAKAIAAGSGTQFDPRLAALFLEPRVFEEVERRMLDTPLRPAIVKREAPDRRLLHPEAEAPSLSFRWREQATASQSDARP